MAREMKDSGVNWLPKIPSTWGVKPLKNLFTVGKGLSITKENLEEQGVPTVSYGQIHAKYNTGTKLDGRMFRYVNESYLKTNPHAIVSKGCFVFADTSEDLEGCGNCIYVDKDESFFAGYHTVTLFPKGGLENKYYAYLFKTDEWRSQIRAGLTEVKLYSVSQKVIRRTQIIDPPLKEQHRIASFLDSKCAEIDKAIEATKASIEEYRKLRQAIITEAVTKGLDPDVEMKDSGVKWIRNIKTTWKVIDLKYCLKEPLKYGASESGVEYDEKLPRYIRITDIDSAGHLKDDNKLSLAEKQAEGYILKNNSLLFARSGATVGKAFLYTESLGRAAFAGYLISAVTNNRIISPYWLLYYTQSSIYKEWCSYIFNQATIQNIGADKYANLPITVPSIEEQKSILSYLDSKCAEIDSLIKSKEKLIQELTAYRKSLIYEYVTGKKEVPAV